MATDAPSKHSIVPAWRLAKNLLYPHMLAAGRVLALYMMQYFARGAAAGRSTSIASGKFEPIYGYGYCDGPINSYEYPSIDMLYEACRGMPSLVLPPLEAGGMNPVEIATAKADAVLSSCLTARIEPDELASSFSLCCFRVLLILKKIFSAANVRRVFGGDSPVRLAAEKSCTAAGTTAAGRAEAILAQIRAKITSHIADLETATFSEMSKDIETPVDLLLHLFQRSRHMKEPFLQIVSRYLKHILNDEAPMSTLHDVTKPVLRTMLEQDFYGKSLRLELEKAVVRQIATLSQRHFVVLFSTVHFRHKPHILFSAYVLNGQDQYVNPLFMQNYIKFCNDRTIITTGEMNLLRERYYESDYFFRERLGDCRDGVAVISELTPYFLYPWISKQFIVEREEDPTRTSLFQKVMARIPLRVIMEMLEMAVVAENHVSTFINMLQPKLLKRLYSRVRKADSSFRVKRIREIMKARIAAQRKMMESEAKCET